MLYKARKPDQDTVSLLKDLEPVVTGLGFALIELDLFRHGRSRKKTEGIEAESQKGGKRAGSAQVRLVVAGGAGQEGDISVKTEVNPSGIGTDELSRIHRAVLPRLELALEGADLYVEVSSPGTNRHIKEGAEFHHYSGRTVKCWRTGADSWDRGILRGSDEEKILLETEKGVVEMKYETIAKARLDG